MSDSENDDDGRAPLLAPAASFTPQMAAAALNAPSAADAAAAAADLDAAQQPALLAAARTATSDLTTSGTGSDTDTGSDTNGNEDASAGLGKDLGARPRSLWRLYVSHGMTAWTLRMWEFAAALLLMHVQPNSLALPSALQLTIGLASALGSTGVGAMVDRMPRLAAARRSLVVNKIAFAAAAICVYGVLRHWGAQDRSSSDSGSDAGRPAEDATFWALVIGIMLMTAVGHLAYTGNRLSVEKDWVLTLLQRDTAAIATANAVLRRIDLSCKLLAPMIAGFIMTYAGPKAGALTIALWNIGSALPELHLLQRLYNNFPVLQAPRRTPAAAAGQTDTGRVGCGARMAEPLTVLLGGWRVYAEQITLRPGLAYALLYGSMLSLGPVMTAYAYARGMREATLGGLRGIGAIMGISATFFSAPLQRRLGMAPTGLLAIWLQLATLVFCLVSAAIAQPALGDCSALEDDALGACRRTRAIELGLLMTGTITARVGLWLYDLTVSQMLQQCVPEDRVGTINGVQSSLNMIFEISAPLLAVIMSRPEDFPVLTIISFSYVALAALLYTSFYAFVRDERQSVGKHAEVLFKSRPGPDDAEAADHQNGLSHKNGGPASHANGSSAGGATNGMSIKSFAIDDSDSNDYSE